MSDKPYLDDAAESRNATMFAGQLKAALKARAKDVDHEVKQDVLDQVAQTVTAMNAALAETGDPPLTYREELLLSTSIGMLAASVHETHKALLSIESMTCESKDRIRKVFDKLTPEQRADLLAEAEAADAREEEGT